MGIAGVIYCIIYVLIIFFWLGDGFDTTEGSEE